MTSTIRTCDLELLGEGSHACWIVNEDQTYLEVAKALLAKAKTSNRKALLFGPEGSMPLLALGPLANAAVDPHNEYLHGGALDPPAMFAMFEREAELARQQGYTGLTVVADMDWMVPALPHGKGIVEFELMLDRRVKDIGATVVCAYRKTSFDTAALSGALCVHPVSVDPNSPPQFTVVAGSASTWCLSGEVDIAVADDFHTALRTAATDQAWAIDISDLEFIDVAGMRAIAKVASENGLRLIGMRPSLERVWKLAGFEKDAQLETSG
jgi:anti-anti-sigma factor